jgi:hypothetical protein
MCGFPCPGVLWTSFGVNSRTKSRGISTNTRGGGTTRLSGWRFRQIPARRLTWKKHDGAKLEMLWRYEQEYYSTNGWTTTRNDVELAHGPHYRRHPSINASGVVGAN